MGEEVGNEGWRDWGLSLRSASGDMISSGKLRERRGDSASELGEVVAGFESSVCDALS